jgi:hypothetical protein
VYPPVGGRVLCVAAGYELLERGQRTQRRHAYRGADRSKPIAAVQLAIQ